MNEKLNISKRDFLEDPDLKKNPYVLPEGYFSSLENSVHERIHAKPYDNIIIKTKPYVFMLASFALIFVICWGSLQLFSGKAIVEEDGLLALINEGYLESSFIDYYYDEIEIDSSSEIESFSLNEDLSSEIEENITTEDILSFY